MLESDSNQWMTVFGLLIDHRMFLFLRQSHLWANLSYHPHLPLMFLGFGFLIPAFHFESLAVGYLLQSIMLIGIIGYRFHFIGRQEDRLRQSFQGWLENILLRMKMGSSFRMFIALFAGNFPNVGRDRRRSSPRTVPRRIFDRNMAARTLVST